MRGRVSMKRAGEKDIRILEGFCVINAVLLGGLCALYLLNLLKNHWFLNFILILGILLHVSLTLLVLIRKKRILTAVTGFLCVFYIVCLVYFNI